MPTTPPPTQPVVGLIFSYTDNAGYWFGFSRIQDVNILLLGKSELDGASGEKYLRHMGFEPTSLLVNRIVLTDWTIDAR